MNTTETLEQLNWPAAKAQTRNLDINLLRKFNRFADGQRSNRTLWWFVNLMVHGNLVLAVPAALIYYYDAPVIVLGITVSLFFTTLIANMGGAGIRVTIGTFFLSLFINLLMILYFIL